MIEQIGIDKLKKLVKSEKFDLELISFELNIPIEYLKNLKDDIETNSTNDSLKETRSNTNMKNEKNYYGNFKMQQIRTRYRQLFFGTNDVEIVQQPKVSQADTAFLEAEIARLEAKIQEMHSLSGKEKREMAYNICLELKKFEKYQLSIEQAEKLYAIASLGELQIFKAMVNQRRIIASKLAKAVDLKSVEVSDINQLRILERKITPQILKENPLLTDTVKRKILSRISTMQQQVAIDRIRNGVPPSIQAIIEDLVSGNIDLDSANAIIDEEAKKRVDSKPKSMFSLTEEQEKSQILVQMRTAIMEKADKYKIQNPEELVIQAQHFLCEGNLEWATRMVVTNLIGRKEYEAAKHICDKFTIKGKKGEAESEHAKQMRNLRNSIRYAEISDMVLSVINMNGTSEEERACFELIENGLRTRNIKLGAISLGKSRDGLRNISLADIWETEKTRSVIK